MLKTFENFQSLRTALINADTGIDFDHDSMDMALIEWAFDSLYGDKPELAQMAETLEATNCAGCSAPSGLIYNHDIAAKFTVWWSAIDDAMESYHDETGEYFKPETCGQLVWFAVEWRAHQLAGLLESLPTEDESDPEGSEDQTAWLAAYSV